MRDAVAQQAPELLEQVIDLVGDDPFARVEEGTAYAQPAIFCASLAGWLALDPEQREATEYFGGHSLGELGALVAAG
ncbi:MAG: hypothetical protein J2O48_11055, partial [Solirubrobacterales bacterium]|nr:hypothetical protein [Solirubrobacterales bacterium]